VLAVVGLDEAEHLLLALGELFVHSVQVDTRVVGKQSRSARGAGGSGAGAPAGGSAGLDVEVGLVEHLALVELE
jgi:hypothetical protein